MTAPLGHGALSAAAGRLAAGGQLPAARPAQPRPARRTDESQLTRLLQVAGRAATGSSRPPSSRPPGLPDTVTLDAGRADGVRPEETVLNGQGLVGTVTSVSAHTCTVLLATTRRPGRRPAGGRRPDRLGDRDRQDADRAGHAGSSWSPRTRSCGRASSWSPPPRCTTGPTCPASRSAVIKVQGNAGALTRPALVRPYVNFTALGVVGVVVGGPPRPALLGAAALPEPARPSP